MTAWEKGNCTLFQPERIYLVTHFYCDFERDAVKSITSLKENWNEEQEQKDVFRFAQSKWIVFAAMMFSC